MKEIAVDSVYKYDKCLEKYVGRGLAPCHECAVDRRTACMRIKAAREINDKHLQQENSGENETP